MKIDELRDLTEQLLNREEELAESRKEWRLTFDSVPDMIAIIDCNYKIKRINKSMARILGVSVDSPEVIGQNCFEVMHHTNMPPTYCPVVQMFDTGGASVQEIFEHDLGGWLEITVTPLFNDVGDIIGCIHIAKNINNRIECQRKLLAANAQLESHIDELRSITDVLQKRIVELESIDITVTGVNHG